MAPASYGALLNIHYCYYNYYDILSSLMFHNNLYIPINDFQSHTVHPIGAALRSFKGLPPWFNGSVLDHRSLPPVFEPRPGQI